MPCDCLVCLGLIVHDWPWQAAICAGFDVCAYLIYFAYTAQRYLHTVLEEKLPKEARSFSVSCTLHSILCILHVWCRAYHSRRLDMVGSRLHGVLIQSPLSTRRSARRSSPWPLAMRCDEMRCYAMLCHTMPCHATPYHAMLAMPCHAVPCDAMPCYAMPTPCHAKNTQERAQKLSSALIQIDGLLRAVATRVALVVEIIRPVSSRPSSWQSCGIAELWYSRVA